MARASAFSKAVWVLFAGSAALGCLAASGSPFQLKDVAADPAWVVHADCDRLRPTAIGQFILSQVEQPDAQAKLAAFQSIFSFDLRTQLHGLTLYSSSGEPADGILLVYADFDAERLTTLAKAAKQSESTTYKRHVIYNWIDENKEKKEGGEPRIYASLQGRRIVFGRREESVAKALDVLDGRTANMSARTAFAQLGAADDDSFLEAGARKPDFANADPSAAVLKLSKVVVLQLGQNQGQVNGMLSLEANNEQVAGQMEAIGQGLIALLKLQQNKPESAKLANALSLKQEGNRVILHLRLPAADTVEIIKADAERKAAKKKARENEQK